MYPAFEYAVFFRAKVSLQYLSPFHVTLLKVAVASIYLGRKPTLLFICAQLFILVLIVLWQIIFLEARFILTRFKKTI